MHSIYLSLLLIALSVETPKWGLLGDESAIKQRFSDSTYIFMGVIRESALKNIKPPFAEVVWTVRPIDQFKGDLQSDTVSFSFPTDSLPTAKDEIASFINKRTKNDLGSVRFFFVRNDQITSSSHFSIEWIDSGKFSPSLYRFLDSNRGKAEQDAAANP